jgi:hypothetical protein
MPFKLAFLQSAGKMDCCSKSFLAVGSNGTYVTYGGKLMKFITGIYFSMSCCHTWNVSLIFLLC